MYLHELKSKGIIGETLPKNLLCIASIGKGKWLILLSNTRVEEQISNVLIKEKLSNKNSHHFYDRHRKGIYIISYFLVRPSLTLLSLE
jgi:hypothetical protein